MSHRSIAFTAALMALFFAAVPTWARSGPAVDGLAPAFTLGDEQGKQHRLADYRGKVVVLEWVNPDCPFVKRHYDRKTMTALQRRFAAKGVVWLAIDSSFFNNRERSLRFKQAHKLKHPILQDTSGKVGKLYGARTTPHLFVIDKSGMLRYAGAIDNDPHGDAKVVINYVEKALVAVLAGRRPAVREARPYGCSVKYRK